MLIADSQMILCQNVFFINGQPWNSVSLMCHVRNHIALLDRVCSVFIKALFIPQNPGLVSWNGTSSVFTSASCGLSWWHRAFRTAEDGGFFNSSLGLAWQGARLWRCSVRIHIRDMSWGHQKADKMHQDATSNTTYRQILLLNPSHEWGWYGRSSDVRERNSPLGKTCCIHQAGTPICQLLLFVFNIYHIL